LLTAAYHRALTPDPARPQQQQAPDLRSVPTPDPTAADAVRPDSSLQQVVWRGRKVLFAAGPARVEPLPPHAKPPRSARRREDDGGPGT
jgi:hypothetical protein